MDELKKLLAANKLTVGKEKTMKALRNSQLRKVFLASNAQPGLAKDIEYYRGMAGVEVETLGLTNEEVGQVCRKPFSISVLGVLR
jgi:large subunit ribosomal protein L30e